MTINSAAIESIRIGGLSLPELMRQVASEITEDRSVRRAAELAYFLVLSLFPLLVCVFALLTLFPKSQQLMMDYFSQVLPAQAHSVLQEWVKNVLSVKQSGIFSFSLLFTLWSASTGVTSLMDMLNIAYEVEEGRSFWKARLVAVALILALGLLVLGGAAVIAMGNHLLSWILHAVGISDVNERLWDFVTSLIGLGMLFTGITTLYHFAPNIEQRPSWHSAGSIFAFLASLGASFLFSVYLNLAPSFSLVYGSLSAFIVLMLWLYLMSLILIIGAQINSILERANGQRARPREKRIKKDPGR